MAKRWTEEKINHQKEVLKNQLINGSGRFAVFVLRTFKYIEWECKQNNSNWCYAYKTNSRKLISYVYNGPEDHMASEVVDDAKNNLKQMGYIGYRKENDIWKLYIKKEIDFCNINQYVQDSPDEDDFFERVYKHLLNNGIKIYRYQKSCWKCHKDTDIYTYFLGKQLEAELGQEYIPYRYFIKNNDLYDKVGIGSIEKLDEYLSHIYPQIQKRFSREMNEAYFMCCCQHCRAHQGINFTVYRPIELMNGNQDLQNYTVNVIDIKEAGISKSIIKKLY